MDYSVYSGAFKFDDIETPLRTYLIIMIDFLKDKKVVVVGLGRSGVAAAKYASLRGAHVFVSEKRNFSELKDVVSQLQNLRIEYSFGQNDPQLLLNADLIVASPGVPLDICGFNDVRKKGIPIVSELELAVREIEKPIIAVTGTNGKTTTTRLIDHLLSSCGLKTCVGGNIGTALLDLINEANRADWVIAEVSSYQIETTPSLSPKIAVLLNITPDHLDRHISFKKYANIKARLFELLDKESYGIYNVADETVKRSVKKSAAYLIPFDATSKRDTGGWFEKGALWTKIFTEKASKWSLEGVMLKGAHNRENILASIITAVLCGCEKEKIQIALKSFRGLSHRIEFVCEYNGVRYYNDSKGTNVGATLAALEYFDEPVILIAGGQDKQTGYEVLIPAVKSKVKLLILLGESKLKMEKDLGKYTKTVLVDTMEEAVDIASQCANAGDVVLLSPACASFDMFKDYAERGDVFVRAVKKIAG